MTTVTHHSGNPGADTSGPEMPSWQERAEAAYERVTNQRALRHLESATPDITKLDRKLTELGVDPLAVPGGGWYRLSSDGTVTATLCEASFDPDTEVYQRPVWAHALHGRLWLTAGDDEGAGIGDVGELDSIADIGQALIDGPRPRPLPRGFAVDAQQAAAETHYGLSSDAEAIHRSLTGLTYAVLALVEEVKTAQLEIARSICVSSGRL
jgi:hypothetical protein